MQYGIQLYDDLRAMIRACESLHADRRPIENLHAILVQTSGSVARVPSGVYGRIPEKSVYSLPLGRNAPKLSRFLLLILFLILLLTLRLT